VDEVPATLTALTETEAVFEVGLGPGGLSLVALGALLVIGLGLLNVRRLPLRRRLLLAGLRTSAVLLVVGLLLQPALQRREGTRIRNRVPVLVDASASMALRDRPGSPSRAELAARWLTEQLPALPALTARHQLSFYRFGERLHPAEAAALATGYPADEQASRLLEALEEAAGKAGEEELGGIVLLSDGLDNGLLGRRAIQGQPLDAELEERLRLLGAPVHTVFVGEVGGLVDLAVQRVIHDDFAFVRNVLDLDVDVLATGVSEGTVQVLLSEEGRPLQTRPLELEPGRSRYRLRFSFTPAQVGRHHYRVSLPHLRGETILDNNRQDFLINILRDRIRVLQVSGRPSWDQRFLRDFLKKSPNVDLISFFILRTATNLHLVPSSELSLIPFPAQELFEKELGSFDVVIFQNFDYRPYQMRRFLPFVRDYVQRGGGLAMIGGELSFSAGGYPGTPVEAVLPVALPPVSAEPELFALGRFPLRLTEAGRRHPLLALSPDRTASQRAWSRLPELEGLNRVLGIVPGAVVLATAPPPATGGEPLPVLVAGSAGQGRTLAVLTDSTWRWALPSAGQGGDLRHYARFWGNTLRWLIQDPEQKLLAVSTDRDRYPEQEEVRAEITAVDASYRPAVGVPLQLTRRLEGGASPPEATVSSTTLTTDDEGRAVWTFPAGAPGVWRIVVTGTLDSRPQEDQALYLAGVASPELQDVVPREDLLTTLASTTRGTSHRLDTDLAALSLRPPRTLRVHRQQSQPLWNHPGTLLVAVALLGLEWWLRRRWGLL